MASLYLNGVDIEAEFPGLYVSELPDVLHRVQSLVDSVEVPGFAGAYPIGPARVPSRTITIGLFITGLASTLAVRSMLQNLEALCGHGLIPLRTVDRSDLTIYARVRELRPAAFQPQVVSTGAAIELLADAPSPYWRDTLAKSYGFGTTLTVIPTGTAPMPFLLRILGDPLSATAVVDPKFWYYDAAGILIRSSTFTISLGADDYLEIDSSPGAMAIMKSVGGTLTQDDTLLTAGLFPQPLDPTAHGNYYLGQFPKVKLTATSGTPRGELIGPRQWG